MVDAVELIGYAASALIVISLMMTSLLRLRIINLVGSVTFSIYAVLIGSLPVLLTNVAITLINVHHLTRLWRDRSHDAYYEVVAVDSASPLLRRFVDFHARDIARFQPAFPGLREEHLAWMVLREAVPVGAVLAAPRADGEAHVDLDYVTEPHRDFTPGSVLFGDSGAFRARGVSRVVTQPGTAAHQHYLRRMGFRAAGDAWSRQVA